MTEVVHVLDDRALAVFAEKGKQGGAQIQQSGNANGVKVRRIMQITRDLSRKPFDRLRILDLACGEGVYAIEAGLRGAEVTAVDARSARMDDGKAIAERAGLRNVTFLQQDIRTLRADTSGRFDAIYFLGILYHLDAPDIFPMMQLLHAMCNHLLIIDTHITDSPDATYEHNGMTYHGRYIWEHDPKDPQLIRDARLLASIDNPQSFYLSRESLVKLLKTVGFSSVFQCHGPAEPGKSADRVTIVAVRSEEVRISTYPWINGKTELEIEAFLNVKSDAPSKTSVQPSHVHRATFASLVNRALRPLGLEVRRTR